MTDVAPKKAENGTKFTMNDGSVLVVVEYINARNIIVQFEDMKTERFRAHIGNLRKGKYKNPFTPSVCGVGFMGVGDFDHKQNVSADSAWCRLMGYAANKKVKRKAERNNTVCEQWTNFQEFCKWYYSMPNSKSAGLEVDKDLLDYGNREYSPHKCLLLPREINTRMPKSSGSFCFVDYGRTYAVFLTNFDGKRMSKKSKDLEVLISWTTDQLSEKFRLMAEKYRAFLCERGYLKLCCFPERNIIADKVYEKFSIHLPNSSRNVGQ